MKKLINDPKNVVHEMLRGLTQVNPELIKLHGLDSIVYSTQPKRRVVLISGGGSGHEPLDIGYVGPGLLDAAILGAPFTPPSAQQIVQTAQHFKTDYELLLIVKNFQEDKQQFEQAAEALEQLGYQVGLVYVADDVSINPKTKELRSRGVAGTVIVHKILGAAADQGLSLAQLVQLGQEVVDNLFTLGVALTSAQLPNQVKADFQLAADEIFYGVGIHGEPGYRKEPLVSSELLGRELVNKLVQISNVQPDQPVMVLINGLGNLPMMERLIFTNDVSRLLKLKGIQPQLIKSGEYLTAYNMSGVSVTLLKIKESSWQSYLQADCGGFAWQ